ncbi:restriction endonuclease subunit S, partial [Candidatus Magnetomorum sp. HK-1]
WRPELIPEEQILQSQFPEVLMQIEKDHVRIAELESLFASANEEDAELDEKSGVLPSDQVKALKNEKKEHDQLWKKELKPLKSAISELFTLLKQEDLIPKGRKKGDYIAGLTQNEANFNVADLILEHSESNSKYAAQVSQIQSNQKKGLQAKQQSEKIDKRLKAHTDLEVEMRSLKDNIRQVNKKKDDLVAAARVKIKVDEAKVLILERFQRLLTEQFDGYLRQYQRAFIASVENLWAKYFVDLKQIIAERDKEVEQLNSFLVELGYE